ncbi:MAG: tRNA 2-selenouridine(34) synthase MnmH [Parvularculaceae bacterium]|nr:tRNA 2-selenouridine(34) synthase MnmH [Parvularculaceae bacterium]
MIEKISSLAPETLAPFDAIIDVRSPAEFAEDRIPGAINLPVLTDEERAEVGTIYVRDSRFRARRIGAAYVARNVAGHLETALAERGPKFRPLVYCWRGGMRSNAMATILSQTGWRVGVLEGGYKTWRRAVVDAMSQAATPINLILIDGQTGTAKTDIIRKLSANGAQAIDLEGLAAHKGSVFGGDAALAQPSQKLFESRLFDAFRRLDSAAPIAVEAESRRIGKINLPARIWSSMRAAPRLLIRAGTKARARYVVDAYRDFIATEGALETAIDKLRPFHPKDTIAQWVSLAAARDYGALAEALMRAHYDPLYERARVRNGTSPSAIIDAGDLSVDEIEEAARQTARAIASLSRRSPP